MWRKLSLADVDVRGKRVLMRVDFNVPQNSDGSVRDDTRIREALRSINYVREHGGKLVLMAHLGRPKPGEDNTKYKLDPIADHLRALIAGNVTKVDEIVGPAATAAVAAMQPGDVVLLENTRFHPGETKNDSMLSAELAKLGDIYVSDAFGAVHRAHASTEGAARLFETRAAGFLVAKELEYFSKILTNPERPLAAILGGAKVSDKITVIENLLKLVDYLLIGGAMAFTFWKAQGREIGTSLLDETGLGTAKAILDTASKSKVRLLLPVDAVIADSFSVEAKTATVDADDMRPGWMGLDIGPQSVASFSEALDKCRTVVWNGPLGVFEMPPFSNGTHSIAEFLASRSITSVIGGGDTAAAVAQFGVADKMSHVSTGGGASLELLEGKELPGLAVLTDKK